VTKLRLGKKPMENAEPEREASPLAKELLVLMSFF